MSTAARSFRIGRDRQGRWVVQDKEGLRGGLFVDRAQALKFALFENGNSRQAVIFVPYVLDLDINAKPQHQLKTPYHSTDARQAA